MLRMVFCLLFLDGFAHAQDYRAFDYRKADSIAAHTVMGKGEKYVDIAHRLTTGLPTEQEKFRAIFRWVCDHLEYTEGAYSKDPGQLLKSGKAVCQGYANLLFDMCKEAGLECEVITGYARNSPEDIGKRLKKLERHAWNAIKLGGNWYLTDATWASGYYDKKTKTYTKSFNEVYFLSKPDFFSYSHFPSEKKWQLLDKKVSRHKFLHRPIVWRNYDSLGLRAVAGRAYRFTFVRIPVRLSYRKSQISFPDSVTFGLEPDCKYYKPKVKPGDAKTKTRVRLPIYKRGLHFVTMFINHKAVATYKVRTWGKDPDKIEARRAARQKKRETCKSKYGRSASGGSPCLLLQVSRLTFTPMNLFEKHNAQLHEAMIALHRRYYFVAYPEHPGAYGEDENAKGKTAFENLLGKPFADLLQSGETKQAGEEVSPYTLEKIGTTYPFSDAETLVTRAVSARRGWLDAGVETRAGILMESLERMRARFFEIAYATMHTTGQSFMMAFQASGPHSADRALEALAMAYAELVRFPKETDWEKPLGKISAKLHKTYKPVGRGVGLVIGCSTFPTWNSMPGIYANLVCGNPVIVKPHPGAVLPVAIVVAEIQNVLHENGFDPHTIQLAADSAEVPLTKKLAEHKSVKLIDYTGGSAFGKYIEALPGKISFTEKAGVNSVILDSAVNLDAVLQNLAFSVCLYSKQMCTSPQNFFIPAAGVKEGDTLVPFDEVAARFKKQIEDLVANPKMGPGTLAALQNVNTLNRVRNAKHLGKVLLDAKIVAQPGFEKAMTCSPVLLEVESKDKVVFEAELFGPIIVLVKTKDTAESVSLAKEMAAKHGAITCAAYTTDAATEEHIYREMEDVFVPVSVNLTGFIWVNQHAAFSDLHVSGGNPAGNACFANPDFVNRRFVWVGHRKVV